VISFSRFYDAIGDGPLAPWATALQSRIDETLAAGHGDLFRWQGVLNKLPDCLPGKVDLTADCPVIGDISDLSANSQQQLRELLQQLHPWRKGPFNLFGIHIDSEWRSDMKWARLEGKIQPLAGRLVLDVGGGNGYYALRMIGAGARMVLAIDPTWLFVVQSRAIASYLEGVNAHVIPLAMEQMPAGMAAFDTVFSMGVLYHRRSPIKHLQELHGALKTGGQLVLETLVNQPGEAGVLVPARRYAKMRNVWFIPPIDTLVKWLGWSGFDRIELIDESQTGTDEQRRTPWMRFESLADYLDPRNPQLTVEGLAAPRRAILTAQKL
jgi:tRNA (mo5U34)-methyltransferase